MGLERLNRNPGCDADGADSKRLKLPDGERPNTDFEGDQEMETNMAERMYQDDFKWNLDYVEDMCEDEAPGLKQTMADYACYDENTWEELDPKQLEKGEKDEFERFCKIGVYEYVSRAEAEKDETGKFVKVKWVRTKKEHGGRCRLVAQELGYDGRLDELFAGTPLGSVHVAPRTCHEEGHPQGQGHGREVCVLVRRDPTLGVCRVAARRSPVCGWYDGGETQEGHVRNTRKAM